MTGPSAQNLRVLIDASPDGYALVREGCVEWANPALRDLRGGATEEELLGRPWRELFIDVGFGLPLSGAVIECGLLRPGSEPIAVSVDHVLLDDPADSEAGYEGFRVCDLRTLRTLEDEVLRSGRRLHAINRELAAAREREELEASERDEMLNVISHELRTPVTVISGYNRMLLGEEVGPLSDAQRRFLDESQKSCQRLDHFLGNLLEAAGKGVVTGPLEVCDGSVEELFASVAAMLGPLLAARDLKIQAAACDDLPSLRFDPRRLEQVLVNLANNAAQAAPPGTEIVFEARCEEGPEGRPGVEIAVCDEGPGVSEADRERVFAPYVQGEESRQRGGLGLGLAICRRIVDAHGGRIYFDPQGAARSVTHPGSDRSGTRVVVWLPQRPRVFENAGDPA